MTDIIISNRRWREIQTDRVRLVSELRTAQHMINKLMQTMAFAHNNNAPHEPFWEYAGISEAQYGWWLGDIGLDDIQEGCDI